MVTRRSFLGLLAGLAVSPVLAKLSPEPELVKLRDTRFVGIVPARRIQKYYFPLMSKEIIQPGRVEVIENIPHIDFRPERLIVSDESLDFEILNLAASGEPQFEECLPARFFNSMAYGLTTMQFLAVPAGDAIAMAVHNRGKTAARFNAVMAGAGRED